MSISWAKLIDLALLKKRFTRPTKVVSSLRLNRRWKGSERVRVKEYSALGAYSVDRRGPSWTKGSSLGAMSTCTTLFSNRVTLTLIWGWPGRRRSGAMSAGLKLLLIRPS
jgi:hypothetical protein